MLFYVIAAVIGVCGEQDLAGFCLQKSDLYFQVIVLVVLLVNCYNAFVILQTLGESRLTQVKITETYCSK